MLDRYDEILVPEINTGQLTRLIRADYGTESIGYNRVMGQPMRARDIESKILEILDGEAS